MATTTDAEGRDDGTAHVSIDHAPLFDRRRSGSDFLRRLIERDEWIKELAVSFAGRSHPLAVIIEGGPGLGKTGFLNSACHLAGESGFDVLRSRGSLLELEAPFGVVRQLLQSDQINMSPNERELCMGDWQSISRGGRPNMDETFHDLFVSLSRRAANRPLAIAVDDLQWADRESLLWFHYLSRRLQSGRIWFLGSATPRAAGVALRAVDNIIAEPTTRVLSLRTLTARAVAQLVGQQLRVDPEDHFARICHDVTGGNPFLLFSLLSHLERDGAYPEISEEELQTLAPPPVARAILGRMDGLSAETHSFLEAAAILGDDTDHRIVAELAGVDANVASQMADALSEVHILRDARPLSFVYPLERSTVCGEMGHARRARAQAEAARLLDAHGAPLDRVASHLLHTEPVGDEWTSHTLELAARHYADTGQWHLAVRYFTRVLAENPKANVRPRLLVALATAEAGIGRSTSLEHLREAAALGADPVDLAHAALRCVETYAEGSLPPAAVSTFHKLAAQLDSSHLDLRLRLEVAVATRASTPSSVPMITSTFESDLIGKRSGWTRPERMALGHLSFIYAFSPVHGNAAYVAGMAEQAVDVSDLSLDDDFSVVMTARALKTLVRAGRFDIAEHLGGIAQTEALNQNSKLAIAEFSSVIALSLNIRGALERTEVEARRALAATQNLSWTSRPMCVALLASTLINQGRYREAATVLEENPPSSAPKTLADLQVLEQRARLRMWDGKTEDALGDLRLVSQWAESHGVRNPALTTWRSLVAVALYRADRGVEAREMARENVELARSFGALWALGATLRYAARVSDDANKLTMLTEANHVLEPSGSLLEYARASIDLGTALRQQDQGAAARTALRRGADLAFRCRATPLADRAERELRAAGARPRRLALQGSDALTPAERRVAELAAAGKNNAGIAEVLFISDKTVEGHLSRCYQKLGIRSRSHLRAILSPAPELAAGESPPEEGSALVSTGSNGSGTHFWED
jgi:DNA-binding CsgD family transcriptional regulator/tetratricopeptide (TPR) repeat protein